MAKAALANLNPALLADRNADLDTMLHLTGLGHLAKCGPHEIKTIGAHEACVRCARLIPGFTFAPQHDHAVIVVRNGGAHMALASEDSARESARIMVRLIEPLITYQELDRSAFWSAMLSVADTLLDEKTTQISAVLEMKIASARTRLEGRLAALGSAERALVLRTLSAHPPFSRDEQPHECPACGQEGVVICELHDVGQPEFDYEQVDVDDFVYHGGVHRPDRVRGQLRLRRLRARHRLRRDDGCRHGHRVRSGAQVVRTVGVRVRARLSLSRYGPIVPQQVPVTSCV
jgi:hypothetical protein